MPDDAGYGIFFIGLDRTPRHTGGINTMMTGHGDMLHDGSCGRPTNQHSDLAPRFVFIESIHCMTGCHTGFASGTQIEINLKGVLLSFSRRTGGHQ